MPPFFRHRTAVLNSRHEEVGQEAVVQVADWQCDQREGCSPIFPGSSETLAWRGIPTIDTIRAITDFFRSNQWSGNFFFHFGLLIFATLRKQVQRRPATT